MDPLEFFGEDIAPLILQHLTVRDILKCSLVSSFWYRIIGQCVANKIWLRFYEPYDDIDCLLNSARKYSNFKIQRGLPGRLIPVFHKFKWKHVMMRDDMEMNLDELVKFLRHLAPTVESLDLWDIGVKGTTASDSIKIDFPHLKKLEMNLTQRSVFGLFLGRNPKLKEAIFRDEGANFKHAEQEIMQPTNLIHEFLICNHIETLKLLQCEWTFENDLTQGTSSSASSRKSLTLTVTSGGCTFNMQANICKFIKAQPIRHVSASREEYGHKRFLTVHYY